MVAEVGLEPSTPSRARATKVGVCVARVTCNASRWGSTQPITQTKIPATAKAVAGILVRATGLVPSTSSRDRAAKGWCLRCSGDLPCKSVRFYATNYPNENTGYGKSRSRYFGAGNRT